MVKISSYDKLLSQTQHQKFGVPCYYGDSVFGLSCYGDDNSLAGIYQTRRSKAGEVLVFQGFSWPKNPNSESQQFWRAKYAQGVFYWQGLTASEKLVYNKNAVGKKMSGYNLFLKLYLLS